MLFLLLDLKVFQSIFKKSFYSPFVVLPISNATWLELSIKLFLLLPWKLSLMGLSYFAYLALLLVGWNHFHARAFQLKPYLTPPTSFNIRVVFSTYSSFSPF